MSFKFKIVFIITTLLIVSTNLYPGDTLTTDETEKPDTTGRSIVFGNPWFTIRPLDSITFRGYYLDTNHPVSHYTLVNSDGDQVNRGFTMFTEFEGFGTILNDFSFSYRIQNRDVDGLSVKQATVRFARWGVSLEYGIRNNWFGHGYHGSIILSNNAHPYPMVRFQTERPISIPYLGTLQYKLVNGMVNDRFSIITHRFSYIPWSWLEIGGNQNIQYKPNEFQWYEFPKIITAQNANRDTAFAVIDERIAMNTHIDASFDIALSFGSLDRFIYPVEAVGFYFEYAGRDIYAFWQPEDPLWLGPFGFEFLHQASMLGGWLRTNKDELRVEYAQNFRNIFYWSDHLIKYYGWISRGWYGKRGGYMNKDNILGHHMGRDADNLYAHFKRVDSFGMFKFYYSRTRRDMVPDWEVTEFPEIHHVYGIEVEGNVGAVLLNGVLEWHRYQNVDQNPNALRFDIQPRTEAGQFLFGVSVRYVL